MVSIQFKKNLTKQLPSPSAVHFWLMLDDTELLIRKNFS